jgi:hypothetical protein
LAEATFGTAAADGALQLPSFTGDSATSTEVRSTRTATTGKSMRVRYVAFDSSDLLLLARGRSPRDRAFESVDGESHAGGEADLSVNAGSLAKSLHRL